MEKLDKNGLSLELLGPFQLKIHGQAVPIANWKSKKALLLLKYLAARYDEKIPGDVLIDLLWTDADFETARSNLHSAVYCLRKTLKAHSRDLDENWIQCSNGLYWLEISATVFLDLQQFSKLNLESEHLEKKDPLKALSACLNALELHRGCFLPEDLYVEWTSDLRDSYNNQYVELVLRTSSLLLDYQLDAKKAISICRRALKHEPYQEELHQTLIRSFISAGRLPEAIRHYNKYAQVLVDEFDLEPCLRTKALLQEIRSPGLKKETALQSTSPLCERPTFESVLGAEEIRLRRTKQPLAILTISLDEFAANKHIPDILSVLDKTLRKGDLATQWSKRLIAILLLEADEKGAALVQERIYSGLDARIASSCQFSNHILADSKEHLSSLIDRICAQNG
ncbi:MAG: hypothetical protein GX335_08950 [Firmicutes bacterium]|nr:hypothetical protein [Bacillota bacterium]